MTRNTDHLRDAELSPVIAQLRAERPTASALELDAIKQRVLTRVTRNPAKKSRRTEFMRSRLAILGMLVLGIGMSTGGAGLAVSGLANSSQSAESQYGTGGGGVLGEEESSGSMPSGENGTPSQGNGDELQPTRQVESGTQGADDSELPFTGFAAIPILLGGVALLSMGLVLRRRTRTDN